MLLTDEQYVVKWLSQYGALPRAQIIKMLQKPPQTAEKILRNLKRQMRIADVSGGYYIGLDPMCQPDQRMILAIWVLLRFIDPSYISKAGKKTPHIGRFWSGCAQSVKHGLEIMGIGLIEGTEKVPSRVMLV